MTDNLKPDRIGPMGKRHIDLTQDDLDRIVSGLQMYADWKQERAGEPEHASDQQVYDYEDSEAARDLAQRLTMAPRAGMILTLRATDDD